MEARERWVPAGAARDMNVGCSLPLAEAAETDRPYMALLGSLAAGNASSAKSNSL